MDSSLLVPYDTRRQLSLVSRPSSLLSLVSRLLCVLSVAVIRSRFLQMLLVVIVVVVAVVAGAGGAAVVNSFWERLTLDT